MSNFKIYTHSNKSYQVVKEGFCWWGFWFGAFWAFYHRIWFLGILIFVFFVSPPIIFNLIIPEQFDPIRPDKCR